MIWHSSLALQFWAHAELLAIQKASKKVNDWRLEDCTMYITLEPCQMCAGAIVQARIPKVVIGAMNPKAGCAGSVLNILQIDKFNHQVEIERGILEEECMCQCCLLLIALVISSCNDLIVFNDHTSNWNISDHCRFLCLFDCFFHVFFFLCHLLLPLISMSYFSLL